MEEGHREIKSVDGIVMRKIFAAIAAVFVLVTAGMSFAEETKSLKVGEYSVTVPASYVNGEVTDEEKAQGQTAYYKSDEILMDFDVYEYPKDEAFEDFVMSFAAPNMTRETINGVNAAVYRSTDESNGQEYSTLNYIIDGEKGYVFMVFWLDGEDAEPKAKAIIDSLKK